MFLKVSSFKYVAKCISFCDKIIDKIFIFAHKSSEIVTYRNLYTRNISVVMYLSFQRISVAENTH